mgnify:CR=1 FL=1
MNDTFSIIIGYSLQRGFYPIQICFVNFFKLYNLNSIGLRYFNVFGPNQDPDGPYAAVIPKWLGQIISGEQCVINGDGKTSRDFCFIANAIEATDTARVLAPSIHDHLRVIGSGFFKALLALTGYHSYEMAVSL